MSCISKMSVAQFIASYMCKLVNSAINCINVIITIICKCHHENTIVTVINHEFFSILIKDKKAITEKMCNR